MNTQVTTRYGGCWEIASFGAKLTDARILELVLATVIDARTIERIMNGHFEISEISSFTPDETGDEEFHLYELSIDWWEETLAERWLAAWAEDRGIDHLLLDKWGMYND